MTKFSCCKTILLFVSIFIWNTSAFTQEEGLTTKNRDTLLYSIAFDTLRRVEIITHLNGGKSNESTPILIVLDPYTLIRFTTAFAHSLIEQYEVPSLIIVGLQPENRVKEYKNEDTDKTVDFINTEVKALLESEFPKSKSISILGHSNSADFLMEKGKDLENIVSISAMSPSIAVKDWKNHITSFIQKDIQYYISSSDEDYEHRLAFVKYIDSLGLENVTTEVFPKRSHNDNFIPGIEHFLIEHYHQYTWLSEDELAAIAAEQNKLDTLKLIKKDRDTRLKIDFTPNFMSLYGIAAVAGDKEYLDIFSWLLTLNIDGEQKTIIHMCLADYYETNEAYQLALDYYQLAYNDLPDWVTNKEQFYENIERVNKILEGNQE